MATDATASVCDLGWQLNCVTEALETLSLGRQSHALFEAAPKRKKYIGGFNRALRRSCLAS